MIEHTILHVLIAEESSQEFGYPGYLAFLKPIIEEWYIDKKIPKPEWMKNCYHKSFLIPEESVNILKKMQKTLGESYYNTPFDYYEAKQEDIEKEIEEYKKWNERQAARLIEYVERAEKNKEREKQIQKKRIEKFYYTYPEFNSLGILFDTPRRKVIAMLYDYKYKDTYKSKKELDLAMKPIIKDDLLKELYTAIEK